MSDQQFLELLMDEQVKSHGEWLIANFLFSNSDFLLIRNPL
jgi:hypothetical protein